MSWALRFLGVGNAGSAATLGSAAAVLERGGEPLLLIDCGQEALDAFVTRYGRPPPAVYISHAHMDHVAGLERLFFKAWFDTALRGRLPVFVALPVLPHLHRRVADYPGALAEGGANFWDGLRVVPVTRGFWLSGHWFEIFPARHHLPDTCFGLRLRGSLVYTADTRPIPEMLAQMADAGELVAHDCDLVGNPSHSGIDDLQREYPAELRSRLLLYHYASEADAQALAARGYRVARAGQAITLAEPAAAPG